MPLQTIIDISVRALKTNEGRTKEGNIIKITIFSNLTGFLLGKTIKVN